MLKQLKNKKCSVCTKPALKGKRICYKCWLLKEREKREIKAHKKLIRKLSSKTYQAKTKKSLYKKAWKVFSEWVRKNGMNFQGYNQCFTCLRMFPWQDLHAGHRYHGTMDFGEMNIHPQCAGCNTFLHGNLGEYERRLIEVYGKEAADKLNSEAHIHPGYDIIQLQEIINKYEKD